jgi:hypothetical protein
MAVQLFNPVMPAGNGTSTNNIYSATLGAAGNSTNVIPGIDAIIRIACSGAINIRFAPSAVLANATATDMYFPAGVYILDMGHLNSALNIYSIAASTIVTVSYVPRN